MTAQQQEKYIAGFFSFGHRTTIGAGTSTYLPGTGETTEVAIIIPRTGTLRNLSWDCQSNGLTGANNRFTVRVGALHALPNASAPALTDGLVVSLDGGITSGTGLPMNVPVAAGQRVAVFVQARGGTNISRLRVSFELEAERDSAIWQPLDLVTSMPMPAEVSATSINNGELPEGSYYFRVAASDGTDWTKASAQICCKLPEDNFGIRISWAPVHMATKYRVYRGLFVDGDYKYNYVETSNTYYDYVGDSAFTGTGLPPEITTAYINKLAAGGASWLMGGNIGIGTASPQAKLDVHGTIKITDGTEGAGKILTSDANGRGTWTSLSTLGQTLKHDGINWQPEQAGKDGKNNYVIYSNSAGACYFEGNMGIGTAAPTEKLEVKGLAQVTGLAGSPNHIRFDNTANPGGSKWRVGDTGSAAAGTFSVYNELNNVAALNILPGGNLGVGTETPQAKLDVSGSVRIANGSEKAGKVLSSDANGMASWSTPAEVSTVSVRLGQTGGAVTSAHSDTIVLNAGVYYVQPYNLLVSIVSSNSYYSQISITATSGTILSGHLNRNFDYYMQSQNFYNMPGFILKITSAVATVRLTLSHMAGGTFTIPSGHNLTAEICKIF